MPYQLKGRRVLVTGGSRGLGALICEKFAEQGAHVMVNYVVNEESARKVVKRVEDHGVNGFLVQGDAGIAEDNARVVKETVEKLGGLDILIANAGWTKFSDFKDLNSLSLDEWNKCWATNTLSHLQLMQHAGPIFNANPEGGVYLITSSIAGCTQSGSSMAYSVTKAAGLHLMKCLAATQGPKLRINAILPGQLLTEWASFFRGLRFTEEQLAEEKNESILKHETYLDDCADTYIMAAKNNSMTGQQIAIDAGLVTAWGSRF
ncbi:NAD(P)-binding protein [Thozetella sp. PMI_491]|nr:NAD(P)-binding protein [Thozetella sp. PMI_491]